MISTIVQFHFIPSYESHRVRVLSGFGKSDFDKYKQF